MKKIQTWEISIRDSTGRVQTYTEQAFDRKHALEEFRDRAGWTAKKLRERLVNCKPSEGQ